MKKKPRCALTGENGNVFAVINRVTRALKKVGQPERSKEFATKAFQCPSYDAVLALCGEYVDVE